MLSKYPNQWSFLPSLLVPCTLDPFDLHNKHGIGAIFRIILAMLLETLRPLQALEKPMIRSKYSICHALCTALKKDQWLTIHRGSLPARMVFLLNMRCTDLAFCSMNLLTALHSMVYKI
jgi:hypothetical protein